MPVKFCSGAAGQAVAISNGSYPEVGWRSANHRSSQRDAKYEKKRACCCARCTLLGPPATFFRRIIIHYRCILRRNASMRVRWSIWSKKNATAGSGETGPMSPISCFYPWVYSSSPYIAHFPVRLTGLSPNLVFLHRFYRLSPDKLELNLTILL